MFSLPLSITLCCTFLRSSGSHDPVPLLPLLGLLTRKGRAIDAEMTIENCCMRSRKLNVGKESAYSNARIHTPYGTVYPNSHPLNHPHHAFPSLEHASRLDEKKCKRREPCPVLKSLFAKLSPCNSFRPPLSLPNQFLVHLPKTSYLLLYWIFSYTVILDTHTTGFNHLHTPVS